jgi:SGNH domain-containing protein
MLSFSHRYSPGAIEERQEALAGASGLVGKFIASGLRVMIDAPKPVFMVEAFRCSDWFNRSNLICRGGLELPRDDLLALRQPVMASLAALSHAYPDLLTWDPFGPLCGTTICRAVTRDGPLFFDGDHLSNIGNRILYPHFLAALRQLWGKDEAVTEGSTAASPASPIR